MPKKRPIPSPAMLSDDAQLLFDAVNNEPDLPCALIVASYLDDSVAALLYSFLVNCKRSEELIYDGMAPLGTFSARIKLAYCLGLVTESMRSNLDTIRDIRNRGAHRYQKFSFDAPDIADLCRQLTFPKVKGKRVNSNTGEVTEFDRFVLPNESSRLRFVTCATMLYGPLVSRALHMEHREEKSKDF